MYKLTVLTPVHIGTGQKLSKADSVFDNNILFVIDVDKVIELLSNNRQALNEFGQPNFGMKEFLDRHKIKYPEAQKYSLQVPFNVSGREIFEFLKTGLGNPIIPGSSIKGAIRTVFLWHLIRNENQQKIRQIFNNVLSENPKKERADDELDRYIFGKNPNYDFMRVLQISDSEFEVSQLTVDQVKILDLKNDNSYGWWKWQRPRSIIVDNHSQATSTFVESIVKNSASKVSIKIDEFLLKNPSAVKQLEFNPKEQYFTEFAEKCNQQAAEFIGGEMEFFKNCRMNEVAKFYEDLLNKVASDNNSFLLHLGWGIGWKAITGNYIERDILNKIRRKFRMGKGRFNKAINQREAPGVFPKTRKIVFEKNRPAYPTGWIRLEKI